MGGEGGSTSIVGHEVSDLDRSMKEKSTRPPRREKDERNLWEMIAHHLEQKNNAEKQKEVETEKHK